MNIWSIIISIVFGILVVGFAAFTFILANSDELDEEEKENRIE